jgi:hypothetical protein
MPCRHSRRIAQAALARGRVHAAEGDSAGAAADYEAGLRAITQTDNALAIYGRLDAPEAEQCISLLRGLGVAIS